METDFRVKVGEFEGPLEILLNLIEKRKLHISSVSVALVADDFLSHVKSFENFPMHDSADFVLIASTLLLIKSKSLLPNMDISVEEEANIENLEERLRQYKIYKELANGLSRIFGNFLYFPLEKKDRLVFFAPTNELTIENIHASLKTLVENLPTKQENPKVLVKKVISLEEMVSRLSKRIESGLRMSFREFAEVGKKEKVEVIVGFLAMLELVKNGLVRVKQENHFEDIEIESEKINTPSYT